ncbi:MAG: S8 family serine peptidase, partial [Methanobacterium paludis]|nr:S8 family serine peptidase [Methanobacterium paludis]
MITVPKGTAKADVDTLAKAASATVVGNSISLGSSATVEAYELKTTDTSDSGVQTAITALKANSLVVYAGKEKVYHTLATGVTPNDPRYADQWALSMMHVPEAWAFDKGEASVVYAEIDSGVDITHPEFPASRVMTGYNSVHQTSDPSPIAGTDTEWERTSHGTHCAGIAMAQADNGVGIAGVAWQNVKLLAVNAADETSDHGFSAASLLRAFTFISDAVTANATKKFVLNMSLGGGDATTSLTPDMTDPSNIALLALASKGVVICIAAGNGYTDGNYVSWPALLAPYHKNIICVASVGPTGAHASYSTSQPCTTIAAPGGDQSATGLTTDGIISTVPVTYGSYSYMQGTSMASPAVAGCVALLLSLDNVTASDIKDAITSTATRVSGAAVPSNQFGYGIINVGAAMTKLAVSVAVSEPLGTGGKAAASLST